MPKRVAEGSVWHVVSMSWIKAWQEWAYINLITTGEPEAVNEEAQMPEGINSTDIIRAPNKLVLLDITKANLWQNVQLK
jgi:hypothetical protein